MTTESAIAHGALTSYSKKGCRCDECKQAYSTYWADYTKRRKAAGGNNLARPDLDYHGTNSGYTRYECRCPDCKAAHSVAMKLYKDRIRNAPP